MITILSLVILVVALLIGIPVPFAFLASATYLIFIFDYDPSFLLPFGFSRMNSTVILAIPLFIIAGGLINRAHIGDRLVHLVDLFVGRIRGGLGAVAIVSCAVFGSITGSAAATLSAIGTIMFPKLDKGGYPLGHSAAIMANSSVLGMLIPPSSIMILYAWVGQTSVLACFLATFIPGIILTVLMCLVNIWLLRKDRNIQLQEKLDGPSYRRELKLRTGRAIPALTMPFLVLGGIYGGFVTPTEAAALSVLYALPIGFFIYKGLSLKGVVDVLLQSALTTGVIMVMLYTVMILSRLYIMEDVPGIIMNGLTALTDNRYVLLLILNLFMILIGMLMDDVSAVLLCTPMLLPIAVELGLSPIHFAAVVGVNLGLGNVTPPTAPLLYLSGQLNGARINQTLRPTLYLIAFAWVPTLLLTTFFPALALWLPNVLLGSS
jgi:tripartite ATP-independent transporter DctM subunit